MNSLTGIAAPLFSVALLAAATANATDAVSADPTMHDVAVESGLSAYRSGARSQRRSSNEQCSVRHQGRYRDGRYRPAGVRYYDFDVSVESNCTSSLMTCLVQYRTLVYEPARAGSRGTAARASWWESSSQTLTLKPGETVDTNPLGPTRRHSGRYEISCTNHDSPRKVK